MNSPSKVKGEKGKIVHFVVLRRKCFVQEGSVIDFTTVKSTCLKVVFLDACHLSESLEELGGGACGCAVGKVED